MRFRISWLAGAVVVVSIVAGTAWSIWPKPILVETATVTKGRFVATVDEDGKTRIRERYVVAAPLSGRLTRIRLKPGDRVNPDDVIATIFSAPTPLLDPRSRREAEERLGTAEAAQERAKALIDRAQAQSTQADQELTRTRALVERAASTVQALERAELAKRVADRDLRAAEFQLHATQHELDQTRALLAKYTESGGNPPDEWPVSITLPCQGEISSEGLKGVRRSLCVFRYSHGSKLRLRRDHAQGQLRHATRAAARCCAGHGDSVSTAVLGNGPNVTMRISAL